MRAAVLSVILLALVAGASARPGPAVNVNDWAHDVVSALKEWSGDRLQVEPSALGSIERGHEEHKDFKFTLLVKYIIRPSIQKEFISAWLKVKEEAESAKGNIRLNLSKPLTDNLLFYSYQEWESKSDFFKWITGDKDSEVKKLAKYIEEKDIALTLTQLIPISYHKEHHHEHHHGKVQLHDAAKTSSQPMRVMVDMLGDAADSLQAWMQPSVAGAQNSVQGRDPKKPTLLGKFIVKPSEVVHFVEAAELMTKAVSKESGAVVYGFSKTLTDDVTFYSYSVWEDDEAVKKYFESCAAKKFREFILSHDIVLTTTVLFPIEALDE
jgi:quinol monooxygenase YgiN